jgi:hypothetical protein
MHPNICMYTFCAVTWLRSCWSLQRVLNDFKRTRHSHRNNRSIIWLLACPLSHISHQQVVFFSLPVGRRSSLLTGEGERGWEEPNHTTARKPGPLLIVQCPLVPVIHVVHTWVIYGQWTLGYVFCGPRYTVKKCQISMCFAKETCRVFIYLFYI